MSNLKVNIGRTTVNLGLQIKSETYLLSLNDESKPVLRSRLSEMKYLLTD